MRRFFSELFAPLLRVGTETGPLIASGAGTPEAAVTAPVGSLFLRNDGGTGTTVYRKESGAGNTGWVATSNAGGGSSLLVENVQSGTTYTYAATDIDKMVTATGANPTFTIPLNAAVAFAIGTQFTTRHSGTGRKTVNIPGAGTINGVTAGSFILDAGQEAQCWKTGTNAWEVVISPANVFGSIAAMSGLTFY